MTSVENPPEEAVFWMPAFYYRDPVSGSYTPYYPEDYLAIGQSWLCPLSAGAGIMVDYRCIVYDADYNIMGTRDLSNIVVKDGEEFIYNWGISAGISMWWILAPLGILGVLLVTRRGKK